MQSFLLPTRLFAAGIFAAGLFVIQPVHAASEQFFAKMQGSFRGSGMSITDSSGKKRKVSCQITNTYTKNDAKLSMKGKCASSVGASVVRGSVLAKKNKVSGAYIAMRHSVEVLSSTGKVNKNSMTIFSSYRDKMDGKVYKIKQVLSLTKPGFSADFYTYNDQTKKYTVAGNLKFKRK